MSAATVFYILLAVAAIASARPTNFWSSLQKNTWTRMQQSSQCSEAQTGSSICQSARLVNILPNGSRKHTFVTVCPGRGGVCINTLLPRCCEDRSELENSNLECVQTTSLSVSERKVEMKIFRNPQGEHCYHVDDPNIGLCCRKEEPFLKCEPEKPPSPVPVPVCVPKRDIYFVVDSTDSIDDTMFCTFGYVLQLIVAAINPRGVNGARVATVLFEIENPTRHKPMYVFNLDDQCPAVVNDNIQKLVYEFNGVKHLDLHRNTLTYPNVRATGTKPFSALLKVVEDRTSSRPSSVITLTDGKSDQPDLSYATDKLKKGSDPLIGAGIGKDVDEESLLQLASNRSTVVYEPDTSKVINFAIEIVRRMRDTAALCPNEANRIIGALNALQTMNLNDYCKKCMWTAKEQWNTETQRYCEKHTPVCGAQSLMMAQSVGDEWKPMDTGQNVMFDGVNSPNMAYQDWDKQVLEQKILEVVDRVLENDVHK